MCVFETESDIQHLEIDMIALSKIKARGMIVTATGDNCDFVSRFFAPQCGIIEDPVTGSAHTSLTPYWTKKLNKTKLKAYQISHRKGYLECEMANNRVLISGHCTLYLKGTIYLSA